MKSLIILTTVLSVSGCEPYSLGTYINSEGTHERSNLTSSEIEYCMKLGDVINDNNTRTCSGFQLKELKKLTSEQIDYRTRNNIRFETH
jgi:hypothetical protein